ncbi:MFS transporter [Amycolatopsis azurea]|uniref:MFS transporter n=1 Tax=Amycolatopsis azurea DSM 43854 TaxID=1238180 RepID=A0ABX3JJZ3_9PSEU|nr:MFS transporter [Amycolatopsis azurea]OOC08083.1 MFS transporter [Amycolatopsis azurea DSM 43854]
MAEEAPVSADRARSGWTLALLLIAGFTYGISSVMVIPALGAIGERFGVSTGTASWALTINLLGGTVVTPLFARLADQYGRKRMLLVVMGALAVGSLVCLVAGSFAMLLAGRFLQSLGSTVFPIGFGVIGATQPARRVKLSIGLLSAMTGLGGIGLPIAGVLVDQLGLATLFVPALVLSVLVLGGLAVVLPHERQDGAVARMDWLGAGVLAVALTAVLLGIDRGPEWGWGSAPIVFLLATGVVLLPLWVLVERRVVAPLVNMRVFVLRPVLMSNLSAFFVGFGMYAAYVVIPQIVVAPVATGYGFGGSVTLGGLVLLPAMVLLPVGVQLATRLARRAGSRTVLLLSIALMIVAFAWLAVSRGSLGDLIATGVLLGFGVGAAYAVLPNVIAASVPAEDLGVATGINQITRAIGGAFGTAVSATLLAANSTANGAPSSTGYTVLFVVLAAGTALACVSALGLAGEQAERSAGV